MKVNFLGGWLESRGNRYWRNFYETKWNEIYGTRVMWSLKIDNPGRN